MRHPRVYCYETLSSGALLTLDDKVAHRLSSVMRLRAGDAIQLFNEREGDYLARIDVINKKSVILKVGEFIGHVASSTLNTHLVQGISRGERMDYTLQKATELGVSRITPIMTEHCQVPTNTDFNKRIAHWQAILVSAAEQSGRCDIPILDPVCTFKDFIQQPTQHTRMILEPESTHPLTAIPASPAGFCFLVGPEGGYSSQEIELAKASQIIPVRLGPIILRTETVAPVVLSILHARFGDFK